MKNVMSFMIKNRLKTRNNDFKSIFYLFIYYIRKKGFIVEGFFHLFFKLYVLNIIIYKFKIEISNHTYGIEIYINEEQICFIKNNEHVLHQMLLSLFKHIIKASLLQ